MLGTLRHGQPGRPTVSKEVRNLIRTISRANPLWGAPRIHGELLKLGIDIGQTSVAKYMLRRKTPPSQTWKTFLTNNLANLGLGRFLYSPDHPVSSPIRVSGLST
jgi:hypothetical protein